MKDYEMILLSSRNHKGGSIDTLQQPFCAAEWLFYILSGCPALSLPRHLRLSVLQRSDLSVGST